MAWTFTEVFSVAASGRETKSMAAHGGKLWAVTNEANPISGNTGRVYYSSDGTTWTEDTAWTGPAEIGFSAYYEGQIFVHQGFLHLIANYDRGGANQGRLYRRQDGAWIQVYGESTQKIYSWAHSNDTWIVIGGTDFTPVTHSEAVILVWNGSTMTEEFNGGGPGFPYDNAAYNTIYYTNGEWYAYTTRWPDAVNPMQCVLRYRGDGTWPIFRIYSGSINDVNTLTISMRGLFWGEELWKISDEWINTNFPGDMGRAGYEYGLMIGTRTDGTNDGRCYVYSVSSWIYQGRPSSLYSTPIYCFADFEGKLYAGGYHPSTAGPRIWRITVYHKTTPDDWSIPTARQLVCDHQYGDTVYFAIYDDNGYPIMMKIDNNLDEWSQLYDPNGGTFMQVQSAHVRDTAYAFGYFGADNQIQVTSDGGVTFSDCDDNWGGDTINTMEYLDTSGSDLTITNATNFDLLRTTSGSSPWTKQGDVPWNPMSQLRYDDNIFVGCRSGRLYISFDIGATFERYGDGLPGSDITDLELAF